MGNETTDTTAPAGLVDVGAGYTALTPAEIAIRRGAGTLEGAEVTGEQVARKVEARVDEQLYGDTYNEMITLLEGGASGLTFGLTDLAFADEESRLRAKVNPYLRITGEIGGQVLPALFSGGAGAAGALARLTPSGRFAAMTARMATSGSRATRGARALRGAAAGAVDGAAAGVGNYFARESLSEDPDFSAEGLLSSAGFGAILGSSVGGLLGAAARGPLARGLDEAASPPVPTAAPAAAKAATRTGRLVKAVDIASAARTVDDALLPAARRELADTLGKVTQKEIDRVIDGALEGVTDVGERMARRTQLSAPGEAYMDAMSTARSWGDEYMAAIESRATPEILDELEERGVVALAALDDSAKGFDDAIRAASPLPLKPPALGSVALPDFAAGPGRLQRAADVGTDVVGAFEAAQDLGMPGLSLRSIPGVGEALSAFVKFKALASAAGRFGLFPRTATAQAAERVGSVRQSLTRAVRSAARGTLPTARVVSGGMSARAGLAAVSALPDPAVAGQRAAEAVQDAGAAPIAAAAAAAAGRTAAYLHDKAPKSPRQGTPWGAAWEPSEQEYRTWERRWNAANDYNWALSRIFSDPMAAVEAEAFRAVYPSMWRAVQAGILQNHDAIVANTEPALAVSLGQAFETPLTVAQLPDYGSVPHSPVKGNYPLAPEFGQPTSVNASPMVNLDSVGRERHNPHR